MGIIDIQYQYVMAAAALAAGGKVNDFEPGKAMLMEAKKAGVRIYPTNEAFAQALKNEEIGVGIMWKARVVQWQNAGISVQSVAPAEGVPMYVSGFVIPKNAPNKDGGYAYMDAMLEKSAQENFAIDMGYNPTVTNATVAPDLQKRIGFTAGGAVAPGRSRLRLSRQERRRHEGVVGQGVQGVGRVEHPAMLAQAGIEQTGRIASTTQRGARPPPHRGAGRPRDALCRDRNAAAAGDPVPLQPEPVRARQVHGRRADHRELRQVLHRHLLLRGARRARCASRWSPRRSASCSAFRSPTCWRAPQARYKNMLIMLVVLPLFVGNAVRAAGWMVAFGNKGLINASLMGLGAIAQPLEIMFTRARRDHRHHGGEPAVHGADPAERDRGDRPLGRGGGVQSRRHAAADGAARAVSARDAGRARRHDPHLHPGDERLCDAGAARRARASR